MFGVKGGPFHFFLLKGVGKGGGGGGELEDFENKKCAGASRKTNFLLSANLYKFPAAS